MTTTLVFAVVVVTSPPARATSLTSADCINCTRTPTAGIQWFGATTDVGWPYVPTSSFDLAEIQTNFAAGLGADRTVTAEIFQGVPGQPGATLLGSVSFFSAMAHGQLGGTAFPSPISLTQGQQYFVGFLNVGGLGLNVDADNDFMGSFSDPDDTSDTCDGRIPPDPVCDPDGAALRLLGSPTLGGLYIDTDGSGTFRTTNPDRAPVALDAPIINLLAPAPITTATPTGTPAQTPPSTNCVGDCNGDGEATVNEILAMVNIALGNAAATSCTAGDANRDGQITINEILAAVNNALNGCGPAGTPRPTPTATPSVGSLQQGAAVAGQTILTVDSVAIISSVIAAVANGVQLGGAAAIGSEAGDLTRPRGSTGQAAGTCPQGGTATRVGNPILGETLTLNGCKAATADGSVTFDGSVSFGLLAPLSIDLQATFEGQNGVTRETANAKLSGSVAPTLGGSCYLTAADFTLTGTLSTMMPNGPTVGVTFGDTLVTINNITFNPSCVPVVYDVTLDGAATLLDPNGGTQSVTFEQLVLHIDSSGSSTILTVNGGMQSPCFGGTVTLTTQTSLTVPNDSDCPTAGMIGVTGAQAQAEVTFQSDGSVMVQGSASGSLTAPNCLDPRLLMCAA